MVKEHESETGPWMKIARHFHARSTDLEAVANLEGRLTWVSPGWADALGWSEDELTARAFTDFVHPEDMERTRREGEAFARDHYSVTFFENRYRTKSGAYRWLQWNAMRVGDEILCKVRDVTDRKRVELEALERLEWLRMAESLGEVGYWRVSRNGRIDWSDACYRIYGFEPGEALDLERAYQAYHPDDEPKVRECVERAIREKSDWHLEGRVIWPGGETRLTKSAGRCELDASGEVVALIGVVRDITDQRRMEESLRQSERMASLGTLASAVAHEINNPLTYILTNIDLLTGELADVTSREQFEMLIEARRGAEQVRKVVSGLKAFSKIGSSVRESIDVPETIELALRMVGNELRHKARVETRVDALPSVAGDPSELLQVLTNLLVNAAQAIPEGAADAHCIEVRAAVESAQVQITIADTGIGLPDEAPGRIFEPFFTTKRQGEGTGLGLSVSLGIIERMGGRLTLTAGTERGVCATILLPVSKIEQVGDPDEVESVPPIRSRVLLIDDDARVSRAMKRMLSRHYDVETFEDGRAALHRICSEAPEIILCDLMMPGFSGVELYEELGARRPELLNRIVFITGGAFGAEARAFLKGVNTPVLDKPIDFKVLNELIRERVALG